MGDGLDGVVGAVAVLLAVAEDLVVFEAADDVFRAGTHLAVRGVVGLLSGRQGTSRTFAVRHDHPAIEVGAVAYARP